MRDNAVKDLFDQDQTRVGNCNMSQIHGHTFAGSSTEHGQLQYEKYTQQTAVKIYSLLLVVLLIPTSC